MAISAALGERGTVEVPAGVLEYRERGSGPPVVFVHGAAVNGDLWRKVAPELAERWRCIVPDLPLGGHSIPLNDGPDLSLFGAADILASFLAALDLTDVDAGGQRHGRRDLAGARRPPPRTGRPARADLVRRLRELPAEGRRLPEAGLALAPALWLLSQTMRLRLFQRLPIAYGWATHAPIEPAIMESFLGLPALERRRAARLRRAPAGSRRARHAGRRPRRSRGFDKPALVTWAADDRFFPREHGQRLAELLPQGRFELIERSRTFIPEDNPARLVELVREFLEE